MYNFKSAFLHASIGILALATAKSASAQTLFSVTPHAEAGQPITVTGSGFDSTSGLTLRRYASDGTLGAPMSMTVSSQTALSLQTQIPSSVAFGVYRLDASSATGAGGSILVNMPTVQWVSLTQAMPGGAVRLIGRNFRSGRLMPSVRLVDTTTGVSLSATVGKSSDYDATFSVPAGAVVGHVYNVLINSNLGGSASETTAPTTLTIQAAGTDVYGLGVPWGSEFSAIAANSYNLKTDSRLTLHAAGDGVTNDARALQAAINYASSQGGGQVFIPAGTYLVDDGTMIQLQPKVVLVGDTSGKATLKFGYRFNATTPPVGGAFGLQFVDGYNSGMQNLTVLNVNGNTTANGVVRGCYDSSATTNHFFLKNVAFQLNNGRAVLAPRLRGAVIAGCTFTSTSLADGPISLEAARDLVLTGNTLNWRCGKVNFNFTARDIVEGNTFSIDNADYGSTIETGGMEASFGQDLFISGNQFLGLGNWNGAKEGEMIMSQRSNVQDYWSAGKVVSATSTTLVQSLNWSGSWLSPWQDTLDRSFVAITKGKGAGQWRRVIGHDATSLTVNRPWDVVPDSTSIYAVGSLVALDLTIIGNTMKQSNSGVMLYEGGLNCAVDNNTLVNCGGIILRADSEPAPADATKFSQCILWENSIRGNNISTTSPITTATISLSADIVAPVGTQSPMGSLVLSTLISNNTIVGSNFHLDRVFFSYDGIEVLNVQELSLPMDPTTNLGYNIFNNSITGSLMPYRLP